MRCVLALACVLTLFGFQRPALADTAVVPVGFDYPLLRSLLVARHFNDAGETAVVLNEENGCRNVTLSHPQLTPLGWALRTTADVSVKTGVMMLGECVSPDVWEGVIDIDQRIELDATTARLRFVTLESYIRGKHGRSAPFGSLLYAVLKERAHERLDRFSIDLTPLLDDLKAGLLDFVPEAKRARARKILNEARPLRARADDDQLRISYVVETPVDDKTPPPPPPLADEELENFIALWETWDEYFVMSALSLSDTLLTDEERRDLLETLLETRSTFDEALSAHSLERDMVRDQFEGAWRTLGPLMRRGLTGPNALATRGPEAILKMIPFFSASEALTALDRLGPILGMEISVNGLTRLARMMSESDTGILVYDQTFRPALRKTFGLEPFVAPAKSPTNSSLDILWRVFFPVVEAAEEIETGKPPLEHVLEWLPEKQPMTEYVEKARGLLTTKREEPGRNGQIPTDLRPWFAQVVEATAWQESCFSQFKIAGNDYEYLRSYNGSSVGLMQINERVWRGMYEIPPLRWDVDYNAAAGVDILSLYLSQFALPKAKKLKTKLQPDLMAGALYAMYNGGPGQFKKYLARKSKGKLYDTDRLFADKYSRVIKGEWNKVKGCYARM